jgi:hypothetical protein
MPTKTKQKITLQDAVAGAPAGITAFALNRMHGFTAEQIAAAVDAGEVHAQVQTLNNEPMVYLYPVRER